MNYSIVIPARYQSTRLPGKPLVDLCGLPMVVRTYRQCTKVCPPDIVYVATDDERIAAVCKQYGIKMLMTSTNCLTGTDRVAECAELLDSDYFINVQGDEPLFNPEDISSLIDAIKMYPGQIINGYCKIGDEEMFRSGSTPKVVFRPDGRLLYMSRAPVPSNKKHGFDVAWRQVCAYVFPRKALEAFSSHPNKTVLEQIEDIEILRFLEIGWDVRMIELSDKSVPVDNPEDVSLVERLIREKPSYDGG